MNIYRVNLKTLWKIRIPAFRWEHLLKLWYRNSNCYWWTNDRSLVNIDWHEYIGNFHAKLSVCNKKMLFSITADLNRSSKEVDVILKVFPNSSAWNVKHTNIVEIGYLLIMSYNRLPIMHFREWSSKICYLQREVYVTSFKIIFEYTRIPRIDELLLCLKYTATSNQSMKQWSKEDLFSSKTWNLANKV